MKTVFSVYGRCYLVQYVDVVVFCRERCVAVSLCHHGAEGDDDGSKQSADAVLKGRKLGEKKKQTINSF